MVEEGSDRLLMPSQAVDSHLTFKFLEIPTATIARPAMARTTLALLPPPPLSPAPRRTNISAMDRTRTSWMV